jgi:photosystem II stability/assembly factor-like uncharacterized protein
MNFLPRVSVVLLSLFLAACFNPASAPSDAPANVTVTEGESLVVMDWDVTPGLTYWIFYKPGTSVGLDDFGNILTGITPPVVVVGLENGTQYALAVTSSQAGSKVGPFSSVVTATPRLLSPAIDWEDGGSLTGGVEDLSSIAFGDNTYVTVGEAATVFVAPFDYPSTGGVTGWSQVALASLPIGASTNLTSVIYDGARFVALGDDGSITISTDTITWEAGTAIVSASSTNALAIGVGAYVAVGDNGKINTNTSADISTAWTEQTLGTDDLHGVSFVNGRFIAVGATGTLLTSTDGVSWTTQTSNAGGNALRHVAFGADIYVAVGDSGVIVSSADATTWALQTAPTGLHFRAITFGPDDQFIAVGTAGLLAYSPTGVDGSWDATNAGVTEDLNSIAPSAVFIAVGVDGANVSGK